MLPPSAPPSRWWQSLGSAGIALAVPEVPLAARRSLLELAARHGLFTAASFTRAEMEEVRSSGVLELVNLCALNLEEAAAAAGIAHDHARQEDTARHAAEALSRSFPADAAFHHGGQDRQLELGWRHSSSSILPPRCAWRARRGREMRTWPGVLAGLSADLSLSEAQQVGTITAGASVTSPHTIHPALTAELLRATLRAAPVNLAACAGAS